MIPPPVFAHIVTWNSAKYIERCLESLLSQEGYEIGKNLTVSITDNGSKDGTPDIVARSFPMRVAVNKLSTNIGFCGGQNFGVKKFIESGVPYFLVLNPDIKLETDALSILASTLEDDSSAGFGGGKLLKASDELTPLSPPQIDSAGMILTSSLRHLDRGSGERDSGQYETQQAMFGATGAFLLLKRAFIDDMTIYDREQEEKLYEIFPELRKGNKDRVQLFDEAFFAYREDADLAWRAKGTRWRCLYVPKSRGYHKRVVRPENRDELPPDLNKHSVRNRFLLQVNNFSFSDDYFSFLPGIIVRNLMVVFGVFLKEKRSIQGLNEFIKLLPRAFSIRKENIRRRRDLQ